METDTSSGWLVEPSEFSMLHAVPPPRDATGLDDEPDPAAITGTLDRRRAIRSRLLFTWAGSLLTGAGRR